MAKRIIILEVNSATTTESFVRYAMWIPIPPLFQSIFANANFVSAVKGILPTELSTLQMGSAIEIVDRTQILPLWTVTDIKTELIRNYSLQAVSIAAGSAVYLRYGVSWDGTSWSV